VNSETWLALKRAAKRRTTGNGREDPGLAEATPNEITEDLASHGTHPLMLIEEKYCRRPLVPS